MTRTPHFVLTAGRPSISLEQALNEPRTNGAALPFKGLGAVRELLKQQFYHPQKKPLQSLCMPHMSLRPLH